jgi:hypothetical protein
MQVFWLDPTREYLCVRHEAYQRKGAPWKGNPDWQPAEPETTESPQSRINEHDRWREIIEFGRTPQGRWYPKALRGGGGSVFDGKRRVYGPSVTRILADFDGPIPADFFDLPATAASRN